MPEFEVLESRLADLGAAIEWPPAPRLEGRVRVAIGASGGRRLRWLAALAAAILVALVAAGLLVTPVRETVAGWLGLRHVEIHRVERLPSPPPSAGTYGHAVSQAEASRLAGFSVRLPGALGPPLEIDFEPRSREVTALYQNALVTEVGGSFPIPFVQKLVGSGTRVEQLTVNGAPGVWLEGKPHAVFYQDRNGQFVNDSLRLATNTLIWEQDGTVYRIESEIGRQRALEIAGTLR